ncbi:Double-stranded RNA-binding protein 2 [Linum grandiflorum]
MAAWSSLKQLAKEESSSSSEPEHNDELEQITIARALLNYRKKERTTFANSSSAPIPFQMKFPSQNHRPTSPQPAPAATSRILPLIYPKPSRNRPMVASSASDRHQYSRSISATPNDRFGPPRQANDRHLPARQQNVLDLWAHQPQTLHSAGAANPYIPMQPFRSTVQPVTIRHAVPCYAAPPPPRPHVRAPHIGRNVMPVTIRQAVPVFAAPPPPSVRKVEPLTLQKDLPVEIKQEDAILIAAIPPVPEEKKDAIPIAAAIPAVPEEKKDAIPIIATQVEEKLQTKNCMTEVKESLKKVDASLEQLKI